MVSPEFNHPKPLTAAGKARVPGRKLSKKHSMLHARANSTGSGDYVKSGDSSYYEKIPATDLDTILSSFDERIPIEIKTPNINVNKDDGDCIQAKFPQTKTVSMGASRMGFFNKRQKSMPNTKLLMMKTTPMMTLAEKRCSSLVQHRLDDKNQDI